MNDWNPDVYAKRAAFVAQGGADLVDLLAPRRGERILDLGCGDGVLTERIVALGATVVGLDASASMLASARERLPEVTFVQGDAQALTFDKELDAVFSNAALHWMPRAREVAAGVARALVPGGRFVLEMGGQRNVAGVIDAAQRALADIGRADVPAPSWYFPSLGEYASLLESAGMRVTFACSFDRPSKMDGDDGFAAWLRIFATRTIELLGADGERFLARATELARPRLERAGAFYIDYVRLRVAAVIP